MAKKNEGFTAPSWQQYMRFMRGQGKAQAGAFDPMLSMYRRLLGNAPTARGVGERYDAELAKLLPKLTGLSTSAGGANVAKTISAIGGAIGADTGVTADISGAANLATGDDVVAQALQSGATSAFMQQRAASEQAARDQRNQLLMGIAELRGKKREAKASSMINPLQSGMDWLNWLNAYKNSGFNFSGTSGTGTTGVVTKTKDKGKKKGVLDGTPETGTDTTANWVDQGAKY